MKAIGLVEFGGPEVLKVVDLPTPRPARGEVRIRVHAATVNPTDIGLRTGVQQARMTNLQPPYVPGMDAAGIIDAVGPDNDDRLHVGDAVMALVLPISRYGGAYAEQIVLPAASVVPIPQGCNFFEAASLLMNAATARMALDALALTPGQTLTVTGAAGAFGGHVVERAHADGIRVLADAAPRDRDLVLSLGADVVLPRGDDLADAILTEAPDGVPGLADGAVMSEKVIPAVADGGGLAVVRGWTGAPDHRIHVHEIWVRHAATDTALLDRVRAYVEAGVIRPRVADIIPAHRAAHAHERLAAGGVRGRLMLDLASLR
jgi:NADPH:quinone reductase